MCEAMALPGEAYSFGGELLKKQSVDWTGGEALVFDRRGHGERTDFRQRLNRHAIALHAAGANTRMSVRRDGGAQQTTGGSLGQVMLLPAHHAIEGWSDFPENFRHVVVLIETAMLDEMIDDEKPRGRVALCYRHDLGDGAIAGRLHELQAELDHPGLMGRLYVESLCCEIAVRTARAQAGAPPAAVARGGLTPKRLRLVKDYIEANLVNEITLSDLAGIAGVSYAHFCRAFHASMGMASHQYILRRRIELAKDLLATSKLPIAEIAPTVGFGDQSHLTKHFRRIVGTTPRQFRNAA
ncbi:MAG: AraC family transcriptional regulator [Rhizomicrobium sp.]